MFQKGVRVLLDLEVANAWRKRDGRQPIPEEWLSKEIRISTSLTKEKDGVEIIYVWVGNLNRYVPINSLKPFKLDKTAISQMLVRMP